MSLSNSVLDEIFDIYLLIRIEKKGLEFQRFDLASFFNDKT